MSRHTIGATKGAAVDHDNAADVPLVAMCSSLLCGACVVFRVGCMSVNHTFRCILRTQHAATSAFNSHCPVMFIMHAAARRCVLTDAFLRMEGSDGSIFVFGDAATIHNPLASEHVDELFEAADADKDGLLTVSELQTLLHDCEKEFPHLAKHARFLDGKHNRYSGNPMLGSGLAFIVDAHARHSRVLDAHGDHSRVSLSCMYVVRTQAVVIWIVLWVLVQVRQFDWSSGAWCCQQQCTC